MNNTEMPLPPCTSFCQNSDNSNGICRACMEREKTAYGILVNIAKRMTSDSCIDYPQWLFTLIEEAIKIGDTSASTPAPVERIDGLKEALSIFEKGIPDLTDYEIVGVYLADCEKYEDRCHMVVKAARAYLALQGGE